MKMENQSHHVHAYKKSRNNSWKTKLSNIVKQNSLIVFIISGAIIGFVVGISLNKPVQNLKQPGRYTAVIVIGFPGELLIRMLKMLILPLISCSLIVGLANLDSKVSGKIGGRAVAYYISTTVLAALLGLILVSAIKPGLNMSRPTESKERELVRPLDSFLDIIRNMFPSNIVKACVEQDKTIIVEKKAILSTEDRIFQTFNYTEQELERMVVEKKITKHLNSFGGLSHYSQKVNVYHTFKIGDGLATNGSANFLGVIVFAIAVGIVAGKMKKETEVFVQFLTAFNTIITKLIHLVMWYSPIGICSLIIARFIEMENIGSTFESLGLFILTVILGIAIHGMLVLPFLFFVITRNNPYKYFKGLTEAMATAFGTDSSAATLPITFRCLEENLHIDKRITRFILPVGTTINMDGTALYEAVSAIFIAQSVGRTLSFGDYAAISFASILASIGAAAIPHAGLVTMLIVLDTVGLPTDMIAVIFSVDWFLDRVRTMINVLGDAYGAGIVQHLSKDDLARDDEKKKSLSTNEEESITQKLVNAEYCAINLYHEENFYDEDVQYDEVVKLQNDRQRKTTYL